MEIKPQPKQEDFLATPADVAFFGGAAGGGKSYALLLEPLRHIRTTNGFGAVYFRRTSKQITAEGGVWDESFNIYPYLGASERSGFLDWTFPPHNNRIAFSHMEYEKNRLDWKSSQIPLIIFDQLEDFSRLMFFYMLSRNRSTCGVRPYVRGAYNPVPADDPTGGWLHEFVGWYLDGNGEYPDEEKAGILRWFVNQNDTLYWFDSREAAAEKYPDIPAKSFTFIPSSIFDNAILLEKDPDYLANLHALGYVDEERLLRANHKIRPQAGKVFNKSDFVVVDAAPAEFDALVRFWDFAATEKKIAQGAATASVLMGVNRGGYYVLDVTEDFVGPGDVDPLVMRNAQRDGKWVSVRWEEEGGASGKKDTYQLVAKLPGYDAGGVRPTGDKLTRSKALAAQVKVQNVQVLRAEWTERFLNHLHAIPDGARWDIHDAAAGAFNELAAGVVSYVASDQEAVAISPY